MSDLTSKLASAMDSEHNLNTFLKFHKEQLMRLQIPEMYWENIHNKISHEVYKTG